ncbi:MAG: hypothetical protein M1816_006952 [Peltula sp. TS41687]|nr:MAG: hypothetical protein M1816_006952 [Peltula sp. TS41687]
MEPVSLGLAVFSVADLCIKYGRLLLSKYRDYKNADRDVAELILSIEHHWLKLEVQIDLLRSIWGELGPSMQIHQNSVLRLLQCKLQEATVLADSAIGQPDMENSIKQVLKKKVHIRKGAFALTIKENLVKTIYDLEKWHTRFDPSWYLIIRISSKNVDHHLTDQRASQYDTVSTMRSLRQELDTNTDDVEKKNAIFISEANFLVDRRPVPHSSSECCRAPKLGEVIVDTIIGHPQANKVTTTKDVRNLARVLSKVKPLTFGLLECFGVIKEQTASENVLRFEFVFAIPPNLKAPRSLRSLLLTVGQPFLLDERIGLAKQLARSVLYVHTAQFVHKNIRPETVLVFENQDSILGTPFLVGFEQFRPADRTTYRNGDSRWDKDIYRHPSRQGLRPEDDYIMQHDIYSLGVCLLEIGLWDSFLVWTTGAEKPTSNSQLNIGELLKLKDQRKKAFAIKKILVDIARDRLPSRMGKRYTSIVMSCLTCLDKDNDGFGDEDDFLDEDGIAVGVRYIEKVCHPFQSQVNH